MEIQRVAVVGAGTMGCGIAQVGAQAGFEVSMCGRVPHALDRARAEIARSLGFFVMEMGERYRPCPLLRQMVRANHLGRKTGQGVDKYGHA